MSDAPKSKLAMVGKGFGALVLLSILVVVVLNVIGSNALDARFEKVKAEVDERRETEKQPRPLLVAGSAEEGNAAVYYRGLEWAFGEFLAPHHEENPPPLPPGALEDRMEYKEREFDYVLQGELSEHMAGGAPPSPEALEQYSAYRRHLHYLRKGLRQTSCDWEFDYPKAYAARIPNMGVMRGAAQLASYEAFREQDPQKALTTALEVLAFADDIARNPTLICGMISVSVESIAFKTLERVLARHAYDAETYARVLKRLDALPEHDLSEYTDTELLTFQIQILNMSGRRLDPGYDALEHAEEDRIIATLGSYFMNRELEGMEAFMGQRLRDLLAQPYTERKKLGDQLEQDIENSSYLLVKIAAPSVVKAQDHLDVIHAERRILRVVVAAHLARVETGAFPDKAEDLAKRLGGALPADPLHPTLGPITYRKDEDGICVYSWGEDQVDDGGYREPGRKHLTPDSRTNDGKGDIVALSAAPK